MSDVYLANLCSVMTELLPTGSTEIANADVRIMTNAFLECVVDVASFVIRPCVQREQNGAQWFDEECR